MKSLLVAAILASAASTALAQAPAGGAQPPCSASCGPETPGRTVTTDAGLLKNAFTTGSVPTEMEKYCGDWLWVGHANGYYNTGAFNSSGLGTTPEITNIRSTKFGNQTVITFGTGQELAQLGTGGDVTFGNKLWLCRLANEDSMVCRRQNGGEYNYFAYKRVIAARP